VPFAIASSDGLASITAATCGRNSSIIAAVMNSGSPWIGFTRSSQASFVIRSRENHSRTAFGPIWFSMFFIRAVQASRSSCTTISNRSLDVSRSFANIARVNVNSAKSTSL